MEKMALEMVAVLLLMLSFNVVPVLNQSTRNYVSSLTAKSSRLLTTMDGKNNLEHIFGAENLPRPRIFSEIGRDTSSVKSYMTVCSFYRICFWLEDSLFNWSFIRDFIRVH